MKNLSTILFLLISLNVLAQKNNLRKTRIDNSCDYQKDSQTQLDSFYYGLTDISKSNYNTYIRVRLMGQIVDLYSIDGQNFKGELRNFVYEYCEKKKQKENKRNTRR